MMSKINLAEQFFSIQGEGLHAGTPAVFLRFAGCNLVCGGRENVTRDAEKMTPEGDATWVCDTIDVWREVDRLVEPDQLIDEWETNGWLDALREEAHLVLTGGEPMMEHNQEAFLRVMTELIGKEVTPFIEVETNGTLLPEDDFGVYIDQYNVSLKLSNSGMEYDERINPEAVRFYTWVHEDEGRDATFKFVVSREEDLEEIEKLVEEFDIPHTMITLMPAGQTQERLRETYAVVAEACKQRNYGFSPRLQIDTWDQATGV